MKLDSNTILHLSDTLVPDVFISDYMNRLDGTAIRCYLAILQTYQHGNRKLTTAELAHRLGISENRAEQALSELQFLQLIVIQSGKLEIVDIKFVEAKKHLTHRLETENVSEEQISRRERIIRQINDTFFQGVMSSTYYAKIDDWFHKYGFEPEVVYAMFSEAAGNNKLDGPGYVSAIAENWAAHGIKTFRQLNQFYQEYDEIKEIKKKIRDKLKIQGELTVYQEKLLKKWLRQYQFDFSMIESALAETVNVNNPSFRYIDSILTKWHEKGYSSAADIKEAKVRHQQQKALQQKMQSLPGSSTQRKLKSSEQEALDIPDEELYNTEKIISFLKQEEADE